LFCLLKKTTDIITGANSEGGENNNESGAIEFEKRISSKLGLF